MACSGKELPWHLRIRPHEWLFWLGVLAVIIYKTCAFALSRSGVCDWLFFALLVIFFGHYYVYSKRIFEKFQKHRQAEKIDKNTDPETFQLIEKLEHNTGITILPDFYLINDDGDPAYAVAYGIKNAVFISRKLLQEFNRDELRSIIAHELGHIKCKEVLLRMLQIHSFMVLFAWWYVTSIGDAFSDKAGLFGDWFALVSILFMKTAIGFLLFLAYCVIINCLNKRAESYADIFAARTIGKGKPLADYLEREFNKMIDGQYYRDRIAATRFIYLTHLLSSYPTPSKRVADLMKWNYE